MNKKQIIGLIVAAAAFVCVGVSGIFTAAVFNKSQKTIAEEAIAQSNSAITLPSNDFVGIVKVEGTITSSNDNNSMFSANTGYNHTNTLKYIDDMMSNSNNKGLLLYVNTPGGGVYESDELYLKLKEYKETTGRPVWTYMGATACSGGYYISMASDRICANRNCTTGSIGVIMSLINTKGLYDKLGIQEIDIASGPNKAMGSSGSELTEEQRQILQSSVNEAYEQFLGIISEGRNMDVETLRPIADGRIYTAKQAMDLGLIDQIDTYENLKAEMQESIGGDIEMYEPSNKQNVFATLFAKAESLKTKSDAQIISEYLESKNNGGLMYYAELQ